MNVYDPADLAQWARELVADWPPPSPEQAELLRRTFGRVVLDPPADEPDTAA